MKNLRAFVSVIFVGVFLASCADMFEQKIPMTGGSGSLDDVFRGTEKITKLPRPEQLYAAPHFSSSEIQITWNAVPGADYYMVERAVVLPVAGTVSMDEPDDGDYEVLDRSVYAIKFDDPILLNPQLDSPEYQNRYWYRVSAFNTRQKIEESDPTEPVSSMLFRAPTGLTASGGTSTEYVELSWIRSTGAEWYEVYKSASPDGTGAALLQRVRGNQNWYLDRVNAADQGKDFYYMVTAENGFSNRSLQTKPAYGYAKVFGAPNAPTNVRMAANSGRGHSKDEIKIEWNAVDEAGVYYAVYRYSSVDSSLTRLDDKHMTTELTDTQSLKTGVYYYYKVQAIVDDVASGKALKSEFSSNDPEGFILSPPETVIAEKSAGGDVTVKWLPAMGMEIERQQYTYKVYADTAIDGSFSTEVASSVGPSTNAEGYILAEGLDVTHTFFRVATVKGGPESAKSVTVSPAPAAAIIIDATQRAYIAGVTVTTDPNSANSSGVYPVKITWKKPANEHPAFYHVQRSTRTGSGFSRINEEPLNHDGVGSPGFSYDEATGIYTYIDRNETARVGRKYYYRILSLNQLEQGNFPSDEKIGYGALTPTQYLLEYNKTMGSALKKLTLMYKSGSTDKLGQESKNGTISGTISYNAKLDGLGARIIITLTNYADFYIENEPANGVYFILNGNSNTSANMSSNGDMDGTVNCTGMYPGAVRYDNVDIKGGAAGAGTYGVQPDGFPSRTEVDYRVLN